MYNEKKIIYIIKYIYYNNIKFRKYIFLLLIIIIIYSIYICINNNNIKL